MSRTALVIGGGPAGLSAALGLLSSGFAVEVLEAQNEFKGRVCGAFLNPDAVRNLAWSGLLEKAREIGAPAPVARLYGPRGAQSAVFAAQDGVAAMALSRKDLESLLREDVLARGGKVSAGVRATAYARDGAGWRVTARTADSGDLTRAADALAVADGRFSMAAHGPKPDGGWYGWNATFEGVGEPAGTLALYFVSSGYVGTLTFPDGTTNVCGLLHRRRGDGAPWEKVFEMFRARNRAFDRLMAPARRLSDWHGVGPLPYTRTPRREPGVLLAGDAAGVGDPFMGEGIGRALGTGPLIAEAFRRSPADLPGAYAALWETVYGERFHLGWKSRLILDRPWLALPFVDPLLRSRFVERATGTFHRGAGFAGGAAPTTAP